MKKIIIIIIFLIQTQHAFSKNESVTELINLLYQLKSENYTGGLPIKNRELANKIRQSMISEFPTSHCDDPDPMKGVMLGNIYNKDNLGSIDTGLIKHKNIRHLVEALDYDSQETRDSSAYTLSLFGPSIRQVVPYIEVKRSNDDIKGNWYNHALSKIDCVNWVAADYERVLPDKLFQNKGLEIHNNSKFLKVIQLYSQADIEYPPDMLSYIFGNYGFDKKNQELVKKLYFLLINENLSDQKRIESALALQAFKIQESTFPTDDLIPLLQHQNKDFTQR